MSKEPIKRSNNIERFPFNLSKWLELQRKLQNTVQVAHSVDTEILVAVLNCNTKKFAPTTQNSVINTQESLSRNEFLSPSKSKHKKKKDKNFVSKSPCKKNSDIRKIFSIATKSIKNYTKHINDLDIDDGKIPVQLLNLLVDLSLENKNVAKYCSICLNICNCRIIKFMRENESCATFSYKQPISSELYLPNIDFIDELNKNSFIKYAEEYSDTKNLNDEEQKIKNNTDFNPINELNRNFNIEIDFESLYELDSSVLEKETEDIIFTNRNANFDIGDSSDIFRLSADSLSENFSGAEDNIDNGMSIDALEYFNLNSIDDIFTDTDDEVPEPEPKNKVQSFNTANMTDIME